MTLSGTFSANKVSQQRPARVLVGRQADADPSFECPSCPKVACPASLSHLVFTEWHQPQLLPVSYPLSRQSTVVMGTLGSRGV